MDHKTSLTPEEIEFCQLYVHGGLEFAGKRTSCYREIWGELSKVAYKAQQLFVRPEISKYIKRLLDEQRCEDETAAVKLQVTETLKAVMDETATVAFTDKFGVDLSPAPLRAVSVNAAKALMAIYPICHNHDPKLRGETGDGKIGLWTERQRGCRNSYQSCKRCIFNIINTLKI